MLQRPKLPTRWPELRRRERRQHGIPKRQYSSTRLNGVKIQKATHLRTGQFGHYRNVHERGKRNRMMICDAFQSGRNNWNFVGTSPTFLMAKYQLNVFLFSSERGGRHLLIWAPYKELISITGPPSPEGKRIHFPKRRLYSPKNTGWWRKSKLPVSLWRGMHAGRKETTGKTKT
jgi:hypothetical protein